MIINFRCTYAHQAHLRSKQTTTWYAHPEAQGGCFVQADLYWNPPGSYHLRVQGSNGAASAFRSLMSAQLFEQAVSPSATDLAELHPRKYAVNSVETEALSNESFADYTQQSRYSSRASSALTYRREAQWSSEQTLSNARRITCCQPSNQPLYRQSVHSQQRTK
ncbi:Hypothetical_protein [Hexamita inflata]|uniref:Hypothetical_protein n=1 Tax=Hexamita inflata TaxID=28002 RepID=A0AA86TEC6_9EUKA|nr:Hypothetical protein HINF_LOCUS3000 [Hexamita inflata]